MLVLLLADFQDKFCPYIAAYHLYSFYFRKKVLSSTFSELIT